MTYCSVTHSINKELDAFLAESAGNGLLQTRFSKENTNLVRNNGEEIHVDTKSFF
jgi:hypothetical protein